MDLAATFEAILIVDAEGRVLEAGGASKQIFGHGLQETALLSVDQLLAPPSPRLEPSSTHSRLSAVDQFPYAGRNMELTARHASGRLFPVVVNVEEISGAGDARYLVVVRDESRFQEANERRREAEKQLRKTKEELRALALKLPLDVESERRRIARGLHDQVGNSLAMARMGLSELRRSATDDRTLAALEEIERQTAKAMQEIRSLTFELSSPVLYELGLEAALKSLGKRLAERHDIGFEFVADDRPKPLSEGRQVVLYRIIEELMVNVVKHAWASRARIAVERVEGAIRITVEDDGVGLDSLEGKVPGPDGGFGLFGVRQRLEHIDGKLEIEAAFPSGTRATVSAQLDSEED